MKQWFSDIVQQAMKVRDTREVETSKLSVNDCPSIVPSDFPSHGLDENAGKIK